MDLFGQNSAAPRGPSSYEPIAEGRDQPLASRMRPQNLQDFAGQRHLLGSNGFLCQALEQESHGRSGLGNIVLWGPPGSGKTTLALLLSQLTGRPFLRLSAVLDGLKELRLCLEQAKLWREQGRHGQKSQSGNTESNSRYYRAPLLFIDEIHRWNKTQQDALLPWVEQGTVLLVGASTENPTFELNNALLSRICVLELAPLEEEDLRHILHKALCNKEQGVAESGLHLAEEAQIYLLQHCGGDARRLLNSVELLANSAMQSESLPGQVLDRSAVKKFLQRHNLYDRSGDYHYDSISAFIKSVRGSDADAALYWLQVMLEGGENPRFIWRRLLILASEDIGLADPQALIQVQAAAQAFEWVGLPEGQYFLSQAALYLALAPKSNSTAAFWRVKELLRQQGATSVPAHLRSCAKSQAKRQSENNSIRAMEAEHGYLYPHNFSGNWVAQNYSVGSELIYQPGSLGWEAERKEEWQHRKELKQEAQQIEALLAEQDSTHIPEHHREIYYQNRHELLLVWEQLRCELFRFGAAQGWHDLIIGQRAKSPADRRESLLTWLGPASVATETSLLQLLQALVHCREQDFVKVEGKAALQVSALFLQQEWLRWRQKVQQDLELGQKQEHIVILLPFLLQARLLLLHFRSLPKEELFDCISSKAPLQVVKVQRAQEFDFWQKLHDSFQRLGQFQQENKDFRNDSLLFLEEYLPAKNGSLRPEKELLLIMRQLLEQLHLQFGVQASRLSVFQQLEGLCQQWQKCIAASEEPTAEAEFLHTEQRWLDFCSLQILQNWNFSQKQVLHEKLWGKYGRLLPTEWEDRWSQCHALFTSVLGEPQCQIHKSYTLFRLLPVKKH